MTSGGKTAQQRGKIWEGIVRTALNGRGLIEVPHRMWVKNPEKYGPNLLLRNVPYTNIYGSRGMTEFRAISPAHGVDVRIEAKWQQAAGSVDEKFPYMFLNAKTAWCEEADVVAIILQGEGFKPGAVEWLRRLRRLRNEEAAY